MGVMSQKQEIKIESSSVSFITIASISEKELEDFTYFQTIPAQLHSTRSSSLALLLLPKARF